MTSAPNVQSPDPLTVAHERMEAAIVQQIATALAMEARGEDVGVFSHPLQPFRALWNGRTS